MEKLLFVSILSVKIVRYCLDDCHEHVNVCINFCSMINSIFHLTSILADFDKFFNFFRAFDS